MEGRDWAVRDYCGHLQAVLKRRPATVNGALAAVEDFYIRRGLGPARALRVELPTPRPGLEPRAQVRYLRAVDGCPSPRDQALALVPFYAGARIIEVVALDVDDVRHSARKGMLRILGKGERIREVPIHPKLAKVLKAWLQERRDWPGQEDRDLAALPSPPISVVHSNRPVITGRRSSVPQALRRTVTAMASFEVKLKDGTVEVVEGADAYQPDGQFTTFFALEGGPQRRGLLERAHGQHSQRRDRGRLASRRRR